MGVQTAKKILAVIVAIPSIGGLATLLPEVLTYGPGSPTDLLWSLLSAAALASIAMWWIGSHADQGIARTLVIGVWGGVPTIGWHLTVNYGVNELVAIIIAVVTSMIGAMAIVIAGAVIHDELRRRIAGPPYY
jgi:hypothetical protein